MPKKKSKQNKSHRDDSNIESYDAASVSSIASAESEAVISSHGSIENGQTLNWLLDRLSILVDSLDRKRLETRVNALHSLNDIFRKYNYCVVGSWNYEDTFLMGLENILKKGKHQEQALAAECLALYSLQLDVHCVSECYAKFLPLLEPVVRDSTAHCDFRSASALTLAILQSLSGYCDFVSPADLLKSFESVFRNSGLKGDGKAPVFEAPVTNLHVSALRAWTLVYTFLATFDAGPIGKAMVPVLISLLKGSTVDLRILAGEAAAIIYERIHNEVDDRFKGPYYQNLVELLNELATDSMKSHSKQDRKKQRHSFREFVEVIVHHDCSETPVELGSETLVLSSCLSHFRYDFLCLLLGSGLQRHLCGNHLVREIFDLGLPLVVASPNAQDRRVARDQRKLFNWSASKLRTQTLSVYRDKRTDLSTEPF